MYVGRALERQAIQQRAIQGDLDAAANYERLAAEATGQAERVFFLERARACREAARAEKERVR